MNNHIIIAILICIILFIVYKYIQARQIISEKKGEIGTSTALFNFTLQHIKSYILVIDRNFIVRENELLRDNEHAYIGATQESRGTDQLCQLYRERLRKRGTLPNLPDQTGDYRSV